MLVVGSRGQASFGGAGLGGPLASKRLCVGLAVLGLVFASAAPALAKAKRKGASRGAGVAGVFSFTDPSGTIHFTNIPTDERWKPMKASSNLTVTVFRKGSRRTYPTPVVPVVASGPLGPAIVGPPSPRSRVVPGSGPDGTPPLLVARLIDQAARRHNVEPELIHAVVRAESGYNDLAVSRTGAMGLMQLMPGTADLVGVRDAFEPSQNIDGGTRYLRMMLDRFGDASLALAAYNAGPGAVEDHGGIPPYRETQDYVQKVFRFRDELFFNNTLARVRSLDRPAVRLASASSARRR